MSAENVLHKDLRGADLHPPGAHTHVEADITNLNKYTQEETDALIAAAISSFSSSGGATPDATSLIKGKLALTGDLGGTAASPTVPALATKQNLLGFTPEDSANKITDPTFTANSDIYYPSQKAAKTYVDTRIATREPSIVASVTTKYWRGDKTFQTLDTSVVPENGNLYYTNGRFDSRFTAKTTSDLTEGANLYYTDARVRANRLDQMAIPIASVSMNGQKITSMADPALAQDAATKAYVDSVATGLTVKASVVAATTANITLSGPQTIDGVSVIAGNRVLVKNQTAGADNGVYVVASGAWSRATDADTSPEVTSGMFMFVQQGTVNGDASFVLTTPNPITLGTTALSFTQFSGAADLIAGAGLVRTANTFDVIGTAGRILVNADSVDIDSGYLGQASITTLGTITTGIWNGSVVPVAYGGTGAATSATARTNLGAVNIAGDIMTGALTVPNLTNSALTNGSIVYAGTAGLLSQDNANLFYDATNKVFAIGTNTPNANAPFNSAAFEIDNNGGAHSDIVQRVGTGYGTHFFAASNGTITSPTITVAGNGLGSLEFLGYTGAAYAVGAFIGAQIAPSGTVGSTSMPTNLLFQNALRKQVNVSANSMIISSKKAITLWGGLSSDPTSANFRVDQPVINLPGVVQTAGTTALVGTETLFTNDFKIGDTINVSGETARIILTITDDTHLTVTVAFSSSASSLTYQTPARTVFTARGNGQVAVGTSTPTAMFHLPAGTANATTSPLKFTAGTNLTSPESGAVEFDGTLLYYTTGSLTRQTVATKAYVDAQLGGGGVLTLDSLTTTQRNALTAVNGMTLYNTTTNRFETYENGAWQQKVNVAGDTLTGSLIFNPSVATSGVGVFVNNSSYITTVPNGQTLTLFDLNFHNQQTVNANGIFSGIQVTTDSDAVDTAAGIRIINNGQSDALYIRVAGKSGATSSLPTGIGMDVNRSGLNENATANNGYGIQVWDWSQTDTGNETPTMLYLAKHNNSDTHHLLAKLEGNRNSLRFKVPQGGAYTGAEPLIDILGGGGASQRFVITAHGDLSVGPNIPTLNIETYGKIGLVDTVSNSIAVYLDTVSGAGRIVSQKSDFSNTGRALVFATLNSIGESGRIAANGNFSIAAGSTPLSRLDIRGAISGLGGLYIDKIAIPNNVTVAQQGSAGSTTWGYKIAIVTRTGETLPSTEVTISNGNATLDTNNFNKISWPSNTTLGAEKFNIYRTTAAGTPSGTGFIGQVSYPTTTFNDTGIAATVATPSTNTTGNVGIGTTTPTALLHLAAGVATSAGAPLKFTSGTNLTTPEAGVMEFDGSSFYLTPTSTRKTIGYADMSNLSPAASFSMNSQKITNVLDPTSAQDAATKNYVDSVAQGLSPKPSAVVATTTGLASYTYVSGVITAVATGTLTIDGHLVALNDYILIKNETSTNAPYNGLYKCTTAGAGGVAFVLTRAVEMDAATEFVGSFVFVESGTINASSGWVCTDTGTVVVGTTSIAFTQFSGAAQIIAGNGLSKSANTLSIDTSITVDKTTAQTLTNKTLTSPAITTPTGIVKGDVGLGSVENTALSTWAGTANITTLGTITSGIWNGTIITSVYGGTGNGFTKFSGPTTSEKTFTLPNASATILTDNAAVTIAQGGTGQTTYTDGQLLIGNTTGNTLTKATLTGTASQITVTNGGGSITLSLPQNITTSSTPQFAGLGIGVAGGSNLTLQVQNGTSGIVNTTQGVAVYLQSAASGIGRIVSEKSDFSNTARTLTINTKSTQGESIRIDTSGNVGIGITTITAALHIKAGSTTANTAPLQFTSGALETTARAGLYEYNGNHYLTAAGLQRFSVGGTLFDHYADVGNTHTDAATFDDLYSDTTIANTFNTNGDKLTAEYSGTFTSSATASRRIKIVFAGSTILDTSTLTTATAESWYARVVIIRESSTVVRCAVYFASSTTVGVNPFNDAQYTRITALTLSGTNALKLQAVSGGTGAAGNDIIATMGTVLFQPAI